MKIAFTSCMDAIRVPQQPVWTAIRNQNPDVLMLLGDQIYMDWGLGGFVGKWQKRTAKGNKGLLAFAIEMHRRYKAQWDVTEFRELIQWFVTNHGADKLFVCWDDHDFAWNNACGEGTDHTKKHRVPDDVKQISRRLFVQFLDRLKATNTNSDYPDFVKNDILNGGNKSVGVEVFVDGGAKDVSIALLDERWYRIHRDEMTPDNGVSQFLGDGQMQQLKALLGAKSPITIVAGGVPLTHKYRNAADGWSGKDNGEEDYPDLKMFLDAAKSPVLYLGGDIHQNEWGGLMPNSNGKVIQVAASAAARGSLLIHRFAPSFGIAEINPEQKTVNVVLRSQNSNNYWVEIENVHLNFDTDGWTGNIPPGKTERPFDPALIKNNDDLSVICFRKQEKVDEPCNWDGTYPLDLIEEIFSDSDLPPDGRADRPIAINMQAFGDKFTIHSGDDNITTICNLAFKRAHARQAKSVVFFIHGFNNDFAESVDFGYRLRDLYPDAEPIVFSWPAGSVKSKFFDGGSDFKKAFEQTEDICSGLFRALQLFCSAEQMHRNELPDSTLKAVLMARSLGTMVLSHCLNPGNGASNWYGIYRPYALDSKLFSCFSHLLLSAPLLKTKLHAETLETLLEHNKKLQIIVTTNRDDNVLSIAESVGVNDPVIGRTLPTTADMRPATNTTYLDCTEFDGIGQHHNYIIEAWNRDVISAQDLILTGAWISAAISLDQTMWVKSAVNEIWMKK